MRSAEWRLVSTIGRKVVDGRSLWLEVDCRSILVQIQWPTVDGGWQCAPATAAINALWSRRSGDYGD